MIGWCLVNITGDATWMTKQPVIDLHRIFSTPLSTINQPVATNRLPSTRCPHGRSGDPGMRSSSHGIFGCYLGNLTIWALPHHSPNHLAVLLRVPQKFICIMGSTCLRNTRDIWKIHRLHKPPISQWIFHLSQHFHPFSMVDHPISHVNLWWPTIKRHPTLRGSLLDRSRFSWC